MGHLAAHRVEVLNSDGGAARTSIRPQVALVAVLCELLNELLFGFINFTLVNGDGLFVQLTPSNSSLDYLSYCRLFCRLLLLLVNILCWWITNW